MKKAILLLLPLNLYAECSLFIHHQVYGSFGRGCKHPSISYADSIYSGKKRVQRGYVPEWFRYNIPDSLCYGLSEQEKSVYLVEENFCLRFVGLLKFDKKYFFIHRFSDFFSPESKKLIPIKSLPKLKKYLLTIEYFRKNYREMKDVSSNTK